MSATSIRKVEREVREHDAMRELDKFGRAMKRRPLDRHELTTFLASLWGFFPEIPGGIAGLGVRVLDDWERHQPHEGSAMAARVVFAVVDELGLHELRDGIRETHHQLYRDACAELGVMAEDLADERKMVPAGRELGQITRELYRERSIPEGLGCHWASETASCREFGHYVRGFSAHCHAYGISEDAKMLHFCRLHAVVEPGHQKTARSIIEAYYRRDPSTLDGARRGAVAFLDGFGRMFEQLNERIFA